VAESAEAQLAAVRLAHPMPALSELVVDGPAPVALAHQAQEARMLVIGRHHAVPGPDVRLGDVGHVLVESAPCPVVVAGPPPRSLAHSLPDSDHAAD